ncbi:MAG: phosphoribosylanthranilate isomerase [Proteobacteria bacterium]|nr:phosphoribosylanthranilate isomerase [Pseudomonadota bacterium]
MTVSVKICGLSDPASVACAVAGGAAMVGFVFFEASPRHLTPAHAATLTGNVPDGVTRVALTVDADDALLAAIAATAGVDMLQLHGAETPDRVRDIRQRFGLAVMKMLPIAAAGDVAAAEAYEDVADRFIFDAKPPAGAARPGGNATAFDWSLVKGIRCRKPWMLAGGLNADNLADAVKISGAQGVDVSSGVEDAPGVKSLEKIRAFLAAAKSL